MDTLDLARLQFAVTTGVHWLFVILTLGLVPLVAIMQTRSLRARDRVRRVALDRMTRFWGQIYVINYALGIVTGLVMEFQFGLTWSGLGKYTGNVFGAPLALETLIAFFAESTFLGMWIFGWDRLRPGLHVTLIWLVTATAYASAFWVLVANGYMQAPVGSVVRDGVAYLTDFGALLTNPSALVPLAHVSLAALLTGGLFVAGVSAHHLRRGREEFRGPLRTGVLVAAVVTFPVYAAGGLQYPIIAATQPAKLAMMDEPGWVLWGQYVMIGLGYLLGILALAAFLIVFREPLLRRRLPAVIAVALTAYPAGEYFGGFLFNEPGPYRGPIYLLWVLIMGVVLLLRPVGPLLRLLPILIPLPFGASLGGWISREIGRQPWIVYGRLTTAQALSPGLTRTMIISSLAGFVVVLGALAVTNWVLIARTARLGLEPAATEPAAEPVPAF
ncbi:cytochrome ubiquinol oxidase subunit I [Streptosporangium canum]|uniref:cytochrome ubiquinol oxidase subunit I n=1 Tax=Streptosporangium canum TaxID=324952 RepID=UPI0037B8EE1F